MHFVSNPPHVKDTKQRCSKSSILDGIHNRVVDDRRFGQQLGIFTSPDVITCFPVHTAKRLTKRYGDQLSTKMTTDNAVMRTIFMLEYRRLI